MPYLCTGCTTHDFNGLPCVLFAPGDHIPDAPIYCPFDGSELREGEIREVTDDEAITIIRNKYIHAGNQSEGISTSQEAHER